MALTSCTVSDIPVSAVDEGQWAIDESYMDTSVNPGNDFFMYCNGGFWRNNPAVGYEYYGINQEARIDAYNRMRALTLPSLEKIETDIDRIADTQSEAGETIQGALDRISAVTTQEEAWKLMGQLMAEGFQTPVALNLFSKDGKMALALFLNEGFEWDAKENSKAKADMNVDMPMRRQADVYMGLLDNPGLVAAMQPVKAHTSRAHARSRGIPANNLRAIHDNGIEATRREQMTENCGDRGLSARPRNGNELLGGQHLCQRGGTVRHGNAKLPCTAKPWIGLFHRRRNYDSRRRRRHSGPIIGKQADALALQLLQHG